MSEAKRNAMPDFRLMPCQAGGRSYYLDASAVRSVHRKEEWRLNWRSDAPLGWVRYRGEELPILDLARALGVAHTTVADNAVVVETESGPKAWGVGGVGRVVSLSGDRILEVPDPCWTEDSPPWLGVVTGEGNQALCVLPQLLGQPGAAPQPKTPSPSVAAGSEAPPASPTGRAILFSAYDGRGRLPEVRFCLGFGQIAEFVTSPHLVPVPSGRPWLLGVIVWRGRSIPVVNLGWGVTGKPVAPETEDYLIVRVSATGGLVAVPVFGRPEAVDLPFSCESDPEPRVTSPEWFRAAFKHRHQLFLTPDFALILKG